MKIAGITLAILFALAPKAWAFQYIQCATTHAHGNLSFVVSLGHSGGNTLFVTGQYLYPEDAFPEDHSELMQLEALPSTGVDTITWQTSDSYYFYEVNYSAEVEGKDSDEFSVTLNVRNQLDPRRREIEPARCFSRMH